MKHTNSNDKQPKPVIKTIYTLINKKKMKDRTFTYAKIVKLIDLYQKNECLWNISSTDFRRQDKRQAVLAEIAQEFDISPVEVKRKIRSLRATYLLERRKVLASKKKVRDGLEKHVYEPILVWYKYMSFLDDVIVFRMPTATESGVKLRDRSGSQTRIEDAEHCQEAHLEKVEEIYYENDGNNFKREGATEMSAEYLEANYLCEDTSDQIESLNDAADFLVDDYHRSSSKSDEGNLERDNEDLASLKADRIRAETAYFRKKAEYIDICMEKEKKLQPLLIAKLNLEIQNLAKKYNEKNNESKSYEYDI